MGLNTDGEETSPSSTVPDGLEVIENALEHRSKSETSHSKDADNYTGMKDQKQANGISKPLMPPSRNVPFKQSPDVLKTNNDKEQKEHASKEDTISQQPNTHMVDEEAHFVGGNFGSVYTDAFVEDKIIQIEECTSPPLPKKIRAPTETIMNVDRAAMIHTPQKDVFSDASKLNPELPFMADIDQINEEGYTSLYKAALEGHLQSVEDLISRGANPNTPSKDGQRPLHAAAEEGHKKVVDFLILRGGDVNVECDLGWTPLHTAAAEGYNDIITSFIKAGSNISKCDEEGRTPLYAAVSNGQYSSVQILFSERDGNKKDVYGRIPFHKAAAVGYIDILNFLIEQGCEINLEDDMGITPLHLAVQNGHLEAAKLLMNNGAQDTSYGGMTLLYVSALTGNLDMVKLFVNRGANVNEETNIGRIPLHGAADKGHLDIVKYLTEQGSDMNKCDFIATAPIHAAIMNRHLEVVDYLATKQAMDTKYGGMTLLHLASLYGHLDIVKYLISRGSDTNEEDEKGQIPLHGAASEGHLAVVQYLIDQGSNINKKDYIGCTPWNAAVQHGHLETVKCLLTEGAADCKYNGMTSLYLAARNGHLHIVEYFVSNGADVNECTDRGQVPLHGAASEGHLAVVQYLIDQGSDTNKKDHMGRIPFHEAAHKGHLDIVKYLAEQGSDVNKGDFTGFAPIHAAVMNGHLEVVDYLTRQARYTTFKGMTSLHLAALYGYLDIVRYLISRGSDINEEDEMGQIPLHGAASEGHLTVVQYLIDQGSNINKKDHIGCTPWNAAVQHGHLETVKCLLMEGATDSKYNGVTSLYLAARNGHLHIVKYLVSNGADVNECTDSGQAPLHGAASGGHFAVVEYLRYQQSTLDKADKRGLTPLLHAAINGHQDVVRFIINSTSVHDAAASGDLKNVQFFIQQGCPVNRCDEKGRTPIFFAVRYGHLDVVKYLLSKGARDTQYDGENLLYMSSRLGDLDTVNLLISSGVSVNEENNTGQIALHAAAANGRLEIAQTLIKQGSDLNKSDILGWKPFHAAVQNGHLEVVKYFLMKGAVDTKFKGMTSLFIAAQSGHLDIIKHLITKGSCVNEESSLGQIPLHGAAAHGDIEVIQYLLEQESDVKKRDYNGWTPLHDAVQGGNLNVVLYLLRNGARLTKSDGSTFLYMASLKGHLDIVKFLTFVVGVDVNQEDNRGRIPLHAAAANGSVKVVQQLINQGSDLNKEDGKGWTPLHAAVHNDHLEVAEYLTKQGAKNSKFEGMSLLFIASQNNYTGLLKFLAGMAADVDDGTISGKSPLHGACFNGNIEIVKYLVDRNANVNAEDQDGWTPLHAAAQEGHRAVVAFLMTKGADLKARDIDGLTPLEVAEKEGHSKVVEYLTLHGGDTRDPPKRSNPSGTDYLATRTSEEVKEVDNWYLYKISSLHCPAKRFGYDAEQFDKATDDDDDDEKEVESVHDGYWPTMSSPVDKREEDEINPFITAKPKSPGKTVKPTEQDHDVAFDSFVRRETCGGIMDDPIPERCKSPTNSTGNDAYSYLHGPSTWKHKGFSQLSQNAMKTNDHPYRETNSRCHTVLPEPFSSMNVQCGQPTTEKENPDRFERTILTSQLAADHHRSYERNPFSPKTTSLNSRCNRKKKGRSVCSSIPVLVQSLLHMVITLAIILAGSPVLVAGSTSTDRVTLQAGKSVVIPFNLTWPSVGGFQVDPSYSLRFESKDRPFCINGNLDVKGFKNPSQLPRFATSLNTSLCLNLYIESVETLDQDIYELTVIQHDFKKVSHKTLMKEILVQVPPGPAKCFLTISENNKYPYEVHCEATTGSVKTTLTCYQYGEIVEVEGEIRDYGQVTRGVFSLPDHSPFSCCAHDVTSEVNVTMCNDFEWPPSNNHINPSTVNDHTLTQSAANTIAAIGNTDEQASKSLVESQEDSGTIKHHMVPSVSLTIGLMTYLFLC